MTPPYHRKEGVPGNKNDIFIFDLERRTEFPVIVHPANDVFMDWAPSGNKLLFTSDRRGEKDLWLTEIGTDLKAGELTLVKENLGSISPLGITTEGSFYYGIRKQSRELYSAILDLDSGKLIDPTSYINDKYLGNNSQPSWSADGRQLAYFSPRKDQRICILDWETKKEREYALKSPVTFIFSKLYFQWALDGNSIRFRGGNRNISKVKQQGLYSLDLSNGSYSEITLDTKDMMVAFARAYTSSDGGNKINIIARSKSDSGKRMLVFKDSSSGEIEVNVIENPSELYPESFLPKVLDFERQVAVDAWKNNSGEHLAILHDLKAKKNYTMLKSKRGILIYPAPDGDRIILLSTGEDQAQKLHAFSYSGSNLDRLYEVPFPADSRLLRWTPDSRYLMFSKTVQSPNGSRQELWTLAADSGKLKRTELSMKIISEVAAQPGGNTLIIESEEDRQSVWVMENLNL